MIAHGVVHGALTAFALGLFGLVASSWPSGDLALEGCFISCGFGCHVALEPVAVDSGCRDDYAPIAPRDGAWCGVRLDDRFPVTDASFPAVVVPAFETATASSP